MEKIINGHLVGFGSVADLWDDHDHDFTDAGMSEIQCSVYEGVPSKDEYDRLCAEMSGEVVVVKKEQFSYNYL